MEIVAAAVPVNVAVVAPAGTVTEAGTASSVLLLDSVTVEPPPGAAGLIVTVQVDVPPPLRLPELQVTEESAGIVTTPLVAASDAILEPVALAPSGLIMPIDVVVALAARVN